ncbi:acyl-CoA thioesterase [Pannonibacter phragmitetus]|uniref:Thioesterase n=1 Tax=Pannonibacter phragmitetus TaxID=121719 RepID=A0A0U3N758_9HYPH|nr:thioesterase family protein [Pannonibacter phragmitetus]ALV28728.1 thioesterase [Pannonibacter phragmitetus]
MRGDLPGLEDFPLHSEDKLRYGDTDRQGHVNNAVFSTFLETGRVEALYGAGASQQGLEEEGAAFVIARLELDFLAEVTWPGTVVTGTRVKAVGRSSITLEQALFQNGACVARAVSVVVQMDEATRKSRPLSQQTAARFAALSRSSENA